MTPMHIAAQMNHADVVEELVRSGADCSVEDEEGRNPLETAVCAGQQ